MLVITYRDSNRTERGLGFCETLQEVCKRISQYWAYLLECAFSYECLYKYLSVTLERVRHEQK